MAAPTKFTRKRILEAASHLFWSRGYAATTVGEILEYAGANPGSLYFLFKTKEKLLFAVLDLYLKSHVAVVVNPVLRQCADPIDRVFGVLDVYRKNLLDTEYTYGCLIGQLAMELSEEQAHIQQRIASNFDGWIATLEKVLEDARPRLPVDVDLKTLSAFVLTVMEGGIMQARVQKSIEPFDVSVKHLSHYFRYLQAQRICEDHAKEEQVGKHQWQENIATDASAIAKNSAGAAN